MPFATRHRNDPSPTLTPLPGLSVIRELDAARIAALQRRAVDEMTQRFADGHRAYVALMNDDPAAWGWVATTSASIGELGAAFAIPRGERYLWNFVTLASHRGLGIYPRLLDAIVRAESAEAERFWIGYAPENHASGAGIRKAAFVSVAELSFDAKGLPAVHAMMPDGGAIASRLLGLREVSEPLTPCWRCVRVGRLEMYCAEGQCRCDYQEPTHSCAA